MLTVQGRRLELRRQVGSGTSSMVWLAEDPEGMRVAVKVARHLGDGPMLAREAERLLFSSSDALAALLDLGTLPAGVGSALGVAEHAPYVALEWVDGVALGAVELVSTAHTLALCVARDIGAALEDLHVCGVAHGDVKPANILVSAVSSGAAAASVRYVARLIDLGLSAASDTVVPEGGTPHYLAPEVSNGSAQAGDARARDLWALGMVLAEIIGMDPLGHGDPANEQGLQQAAGLLGRVVGALLSASPGARPSAAWVRRQALAALGEVESDALKIERRHNAVRRAYLAVRRREVMRAAQHDQAQVHVQGEPGAWLAHSIQLANRAARLRGTPIPRDAVALAELDALGRSRWLVALSGAQAAGWPALPDTSDASLAERLNRALEQREPESLTFATLQGSPVCSPSPSPADPVILALRLGGPGLDPESLDAAERLVLGGDAPAALGLALGRVLRLGGEYGRALSVLTHVGTPAACVEAAEAARRVGDLALVHRLLAERASEWDEDALARRAATLARMTLDAGDVIGALALLEGSQATVATLETRALAELALGDLERARHTEQLARLAAVTDEEHARVAAVGGSIAHAAADAGQALESFRRAADHAGRAGAVLEEATYLTGVSAAAAVTGDLGEALAASLRAVLLFEHLGRARDAARAALARTAAYAQAGAVIEARDAAEDALRRARAAGDTRCEAYVHMALADVVPAASEAVEHARRAASLLQGGAQDDALRAAARLLEHEDTLDTASWDGLARQPTTPMDARMDWWAARARREASRSRPEGAPAVLRELSALANCRSAATVRGPALAAGARLAVRVGDGETARRLTAAAGLDAAELVRRAPSELRVSLCALEWIATLQTPREAALLPEQLSDVEALLRTLSRRDRLRPLLDQVLDALVLWTGVERGLLLLRAPGGRLVPRAARNLARQDLAGPQRELSTSLAERALREREPIVAVDAAGELPELHESVQALRLRSVLAVPLLARGEPLGVVYLDDRVRRGAFGAPELAWVKVVAALASVAIADARDQLLLRRAARRARRAEARLAGMLARSEAELDHAERELARAREDRETRYRYDSIVGNSAAMRDMLLVVDRVTTVDVPVLLVGESGSGKELVARAIHANGPRRQRAFVSENCAAIPEGLLESALFGHVRGAFTGAVRQRSGLFEVADGGTLFLDEIGEMSLAMQAKLLRVLESGELRPVGSERTVKVDVRIIGATHRDLRQLVADGAFRADLFYRLDVINIRVPPLRERLGDIAHLARHFATRHAAGKTVRFTPRAIDLMTAYSWPGNVRQLENEVRRALVLSDGIIDARHLSSELQPRDSAKEQAEHGLNLRGRVDALESALVHEALHLTDGNQTRAAEMLGLSRFGLQKMMKRLGIESGPRRSPSGSEIAQE
ncbi:MAG: sigma 54-interacting transcriptional regulator [Polyangiaceae bacterium]|nr:sigma 54-interacting transcriptional regulator [Polyangiaceae bacterium]